MPNVDNELMVKALVDAWRKETHERRAREQQKLKISRGNSNDLPKFDPREWAPPLNIRR